MQRHHALRYIGWSVFLICLTTIVVTTGYGAIEFYIQQQVSKRDAEIQHQSAVRPVFWHLTDIEKTLLAHVISQIPAEQRFHIEIQCLPDAGSRSFVEDFAGVFVANDWKDIRANCLFSKVRPDLTGMYIGLSKSLMGKMEGKSIADAPDKNLITLAQILDSATLSVQWASFDDGSNEDHFYVLIGNAP